MKLDFCPNCFEPTHEAVCPKCDYSIAALEHSHIELKAGTVLADRYVIGRVLGIGGFGITYIGFDRQKNKRYAIKEYMPKDIAYRSDNGRIEPCSASDEEVYSKGLDAFLNETNVLITLSGNSGIVEAENFVVENNTGYLIMEYLDGISSKRLLASRGTLDCDFALKILFSVAGALNCVHSKGLLHRDISPENIMVLKNGEIKLIDFGAARFFVGERSKSLELVLKHGYAPPEQYSAKGNQGKWTDIYALAATFYKLVTGDTLPDALSRINNDTVQRLDKINPQIKPYIGKTIEKALALNYRDRYQSVDKFMHDLRCQPVSMVQKSEPKNVPAAEKKNETAVQKPKKKQGFWAQLFGISVCEENEHSADSTQTLTTDRVENNNDTPLEYIASKLTADDAVETKNRVKPSVRIVHGSSDLGSWVLLPDEEVFLGRDSTECYIAIRDSSISRRHAAICYNSRDGGFYVKDMSTNGLFFTNGVRFEQGKTYKLSAGDAVIIATPEYVMEMELKQ